MSTGIKLEGLEEESETYTVEAFAMPATDAKIYYYLPTPYPAYYGCLVKISALSESSITFQGVDRSNPPDQANPTRGLTASYTIDRKDINVVWQHEPSTLHGWSTTSNPPTDFAILLLREDYIDDHAALASAVADGPKYPKGAGALVDLAKNLLTYKNAIVRSKEDEALFERLFGDFLKRWGAQ